MTKNEYRVITAEDPSPERVEVRLKTLEIATASYANSLSGGEGVSDEEIMETAAKFEKHAYRKIVYRKMVVK